jgi:hypothetical protein
MDKEEKFYTVEKERRLVSKEEFQAFLSNYPRKLSGDYFMDVYSYNDFELANAWPYSIVAKIYVGYGADDPDEYEIVVNYEEVFNSKTGYMHDWSDLTG